MRVKRVLSIFIAISIMFPHVFSIAFNADFFGFARSAPMLEGYISGLYDNSVNDNGKPVVNDARFSIENTLYYVIDIKKINADETGIYKNNRDIKIKNVDDVEGVVNITPKKEYKIPLPKPLVAAEDLDITIIDEGYVEHYDVNISCEIATFRMRKGDNAAYITFDMKNIVITGPNNAGLEPEDIDFGWVHNINISIGCNINEVLADSMDEDNDGRIHVDFVPSGGVDIFVEEITPEPEQEPTLTKAVSMAMNKDGIARWRIEYTAPNKAYEENGRPVPNILRDYLPEGLSIHGDVNISCVNANDETENSTISGSDDGFIYNIRRDVKSIVVTYDTKLNDVEIAKALSGQTSEYLNVVKTLKDDENNIVNEASAKVNNASIEMLVSKSSSEVKYNETDEGSGKPFYTLDWEIKVNSSGNQLESMNIHDVFGSAILMSNDIVQSDENFSKLNMRIECINAEDAENLVIPVKKESMKLVYDVENDTQVRGFEISIDEYINSQEGGRIDTTKPFKILYSTLVDDEQLKTLDPAQINIDNFKNSVKADFEFKGLPYETNVFHAKPKKVIEPLISIKNMHVNPADLSFTWRVTINPNKKPTFNMTEILFQDSFPKNIPWPEDVLRDYKSFGYTDEIRNKQIDDIRNQIKRQVGNEQDVDVFLSDDELGQNYILNVIIRNSGKKEINFQYKTYATNHLIWAKNLSRGLIYGNAVALLKNGTKIDGEHIKQDRINARAEIRAGNGNVLRGWPLGRYYVSQKKLDWEIFLDEKAIKMGDVRLEDFLPKGVTYIKDTAIISKDGQRFESISEDVSSENHYLIDEGNKLIFNIKDVSSKTWIRFSTYLDFDSMENKFENDISLTNRVDLYIHPNKDLFPDRAEEWVKTEQFEETAVIVNDILQKTSARDSKDRKKMNYKVILNPLGMDILSKDKINLYIEDKLDDGLVLDEESVRLYEANIADQPKTSQSQHKYNPTNITNGREIVDKVLSFDSANNKLSVKVPQTNKSYVLEYTAFITRENVSLNNHVKLVGSALPSNGSNQSSEDHSVNLGSHAGASLKPPSSLFYSIVVKKKGEANKDIEGAKIGLYTQKNENNLIGVGTSDKKGNCIISVKNRLVREYNTLYVKEMKAPSGYMPSMEWYEFGKEAGANSSEDNPIVTIKNEKMMSTNSGVISLYRYDEVTLEPLHGAEFELYENIDFSSPLQTGRTNLRGELMFYGLDPQGNYSIKESMPPEGYWVDTNYSEPTPVSVINAGNSNTEITPISVKSRPMPIMLMVMLKNEDGLPLEDAQFELYADSFCTDKIGETVSTDEFGIVRFEGLEQFDAYWLKQVSTPEGYLLDQNPVFPINFELMDKVGNIYEIDIVNSKDPSYRPDRKVIVVNTDSFDEQIKLHGSQFELYENSDLSGVPFRTAKTDLDGSVCFDNLQGDLYWLKQSFVADGYELNTQVIEISFTSISDIERVVNFKNNKLKPIEPPAPERPPVMPDMGGVTLSLVAVDSSDNSIRLEGAEVGLYSKPQCNEVDLIEKRTTDFNGVAKFLGLQKNKDYWVKLLKPPPNYYGDSYIIKVDFSKGIVNGELIIDIEYDKIYSSPVEPHYAKLVVLNTDSLDSNIKLEGSEIAIYNNKNCEHTSFVDRQFTNADGLAVFNGLVQGKSYWIKELSPSSGYVLREDVFEIFIDKDIIEITVVNQKIDSSGGTGGDGSGSGSGSGGTGGDGSGSGNGSGGTGGDGSGSGNGSGGTGDDDDYDSDNVGNANNGGNQNQNNGNFTNNDLDVVYPDVDNNLDNGQQTGEQVQQNNVDYDLNGGFMYDYPELKSSFDIVRLGKVPFRAGYIFTGWYLDEQCTIPATELEMNENKKIYASWKKYVPPSTLNSDNHFAYIIGYPDGNVRPLDTITKAEVATIFFRLLNKSVREQYLTNSSKFADVEQGLWYNVAVSTVEALGIVRGNKDGKFYPDKPITRAELASIASRFDSNDITVYGDFYDISGHWAENDIKRATTLGWIRGYPDGTFRPDNAITRAEAMTLINNVLLRIPETESDLLHDMVEWPDNPKEEWYYLAVQEATNSHDHVIKDVYDKWTKLNENEEDWVQYQEDSKQVEEEIKYPDEFFDKNYGNGFLYG